MELGIYGGLLFKSDSRSANGLWQDILGGHPNPRSLYSGHTTVLHFPASLVVTYVLMPAVCLKLICPPFQLGPYKPPTSSFLFFPSGWLERADSQSKLRSHTLKLAAPPLAW